jgi:hypothetical protein
MKENLNPQLAQFDDLSVASGEGSVQSKVSVGKRRTFASRRGKKMDHLDLASQRKTCDVAITGKLQKSHRMKQSGHHQNLPEWEDRTSSLQGETNGELKPTSADSKTKGKHKIFFANSKTSTHHDLNSDSVSVSSDGSKKKGSLLWTSKKESSSRRLRDKLQKSPLSSTAMNRSLDEIVLAEALNPNRPTPSNSREKHAATSSKAAYSAPQNSTHDIMAPKSSRFNPFSTSAPAVTEKSTPTKLERPTCTTIAEEPPSTEVPPPPMHGSSPLPTSPSVVRYAVVAASTHANAATSLSRISRQVQTGSRNNIIIPETTVNRVQVHVYDLIHRETILETPWGCDFPIGQCFNTINDGMHALGTGAYHAGIEINGVEYAFGSNEIPGQTGVFTCVPKMSPGYQYRTTLDFGEVRTLKKEWIQVPVTVQIPSPSAGNGTPDKTAEEPDSVEDDCQSLVAMSEIQSGPSGGRRRPTFLRRNKDPTVAPESVTKTKIDYRYRHVETFVEGRNLMRAMAKDYMGADYDLLRKNCCTFVKDASVRLGVSESEIPTWFLVSCFGLFSSNALFICFLVCSHACPPSFTTLNL